MNDCSFVLAIQSLDPFEGDGVDVPRVAGHVNHFVDSQCGRVESMMHTRGQPQGNEVAIAIGCHRLRVVQQILQRVRESLGLNQLCAPDRSRRADNRVARADEHIRRSVDRARSIFQLANEAVVEAGKMSLPGLLQVQVPGKHLPRRYRKTSNERMLDLAEPAHEQRRETAGNPVGQQKVDVLLLERLGEPGETFHYDGRRP